MSQQISVSMSRRFGSGVGDLSVSTWHQLTTGITVGKRVAVEMVNQGTDNDMSTAGLIYVYPSTSSAAVTISVSNPQVSVLKTLDRITREWGGDIYINVQSATSGQCLHVEERSEVPGIARQGV